MDFGSVSVSTYCESWEFPYDFILQLMLSYATVEFNFFMQITPILNFEGTG